MRSLLTHRATRFALVCVGLGVGTTAAFGLPWDTDMANNQTIKAFEREMASPPAGSVAQPNLLTPRTQAVNYDRLTPEGMAVTSPIPITEQSVAKGKEMYEIYCLPCHGHGSQLGPVGVTSTPPRFIGVIPLLPSILGARTDGYLYLTIRNGGVIMPSYGWAMDETERWSVVHYLRSEQFVEDSK